mmetsp:Transcript_4880/g.10757  ORF Transcript_4880/g.10757 Transcript_4880/m.10757 type:complete len:253 (+) Transcript_4880:845-1603(+)
MTHARPDSAMKLASVISWSLTPSVASSTSRQTSERRAALSERLTIICSTPLLTRAARRTPAVSRKTYSRLWLMTRWSMTSRVVPAMSETMARSARARRLSSDDLPTFGFPRIAMRNGSSSSSSAPTALCGRGLTSASIRSPIPVPCIPLTAKGVPMPRPQKSAVCRSPLFVDSHLLTASTVGTDCLRRKPAISSSSAVHPNWPSTTSSATEASWRATRACWRISRMKTCDSSSSKTRPPVSTTANSCAAHQP